MTFDGPKHRAADEPRPDNQRTVFLDELGRYIGRTWPALHAQRYDPEGDKPTRLVVTKDNSDTIEEVGCDFDGETGWWFVWLWAEESKPQRIGHVTTVEQVARAVASVMGLRRVAV